MAERGRRKLLALLWAACGLCLVSFGCQAQVSFLGGPLPADGVKGGSDPVAAKPATGDIVRTAYQPNDRATTQALPSGLTRINSVPDLKPVDPPSRGMIVPGSSGRLAPLAGSRGTEGPEPASTIRVTGVDGDKIEVMPPAEHAQGGCSSCRNGGCAGSEGPGGDRPIPTELAKVSLPPYMIEPPDILLIDALRLVPKPPYVVQPLDVLFIRVADTLPNQAIDGPYAVSPDGSINLGFSYGTLNVSGLTVEMVEEALRKHLGRTLKNPQIAVYLAQFRGVQQVRGEHLVRPDGTISLGSYGCVYITGLTIQQAKLAIERYLSQYLLDPEVSVDVFAYNSKAYYVIADGGGFGQQVFRFPITGNETVLDAIGRIGGLPVVSSKRHIWVARPSPANHGCDQVLPVDWNALTMGGSTGTNYQLFPGDRIYIKADTLIHLDNAIAKVVSPIERLFGVTLLGSATVNSFRNNGNGNNNGTGAVIVP